MRFSMFWSCLWNRKSNLNPITSLQTSMVMVGRHISSLISLPFHHFHSTLSLPLHLPLLLCFFCGLLSHPPIHRNQFLLPYSLFPLLPSSPPFPLLPPSSPPLPPFPRPSPPFLPPSPPPFPPFLSC